MNIMLRDILSVNAMLQQHMTLPVQGVTRHKFILHWWETLDVLYKNAVSYELSSSWVSLCGHSPIVLKEGSWMNSIWACLGDLTQTAPDTKTQLALLALISPAK